MDEILKAGLDPQQVLNALREMGSKSEELAKQIEDSLGKDAAKSIKKLEDAAEGGSNRIAKFFNNLGTRVQEDLKSAFDFSRVMAGVKFTDEIGKGAKQVLEMERAFDRLNVRLGLSRSGIQTLKTEMGKVVSATGASLEKVMPGIETVIGRGGVKDAGALTKISETLAKASAATGEDTGGLAENVVEGIMARGDKVNASTIKSAVDAAMAARNAGAFSSAQEAAAAITHLTPFAKQLGLGTRQTAGLAAQASSAGAPGVDILRQLMEQGTQVGGQGRLNQLLGAGVFKGGKLDTGGLSKINLNQFKGLSQQQMASVTGFSGASGDDFVRFVEAFKKGNERFNAVLNSSDDTAKAFEESTQNLASRLDKFREKLTNAGREIVGGLSTAAEGVLSGHGGKVASGIGQASKGFEENRGTLLAGTAATVAMGLLFGGGIRNLLGGAASTAAGVAKGKALQSAGVTPVYVTNAKEIGGEGGGGAASAAGGLFGRLGAGGRFGLYGLIAALSPEIGGLLGSGASMLKDKISGNPAEEAQKALDQTQALAAERLSKREGIDMATAMMIVKEGIKQGYQGAKIEVVTKGPYTNPSSVAPRGGGR